MLHMHPCYCCISQREECVVVNNPIVRTRLHYTNFQGWSGFWPYIKQVTIGLGIIICDCQKRNLPSGFEWLSTLGRYAV
jgi:hypothetical protein